jgi:hypothetical protein
MSKREKIKELMQKYFGPASANMVDRMEGSDEQILQECKQRVAALLGQDQAKEFDSII